jgi:hypothetical protein
MPVHELGGATGFELLRAGKLGDLKTVLEGRELRVRRNDLGAKSRGASARRLIRRRAPPVRL